MANRPMKRLRGEKGQWRGEGPMDGRRAKGGRKGQWRERRASGGKKGKWREEGPMEERRANGGEKGQWRG